MAAVGRAGWSCRRRPHHGDKGCVTYALGSKLMDSLLLEVLAMAAGRNTGMGTNAEATAAKHAKATMVGRMLVCWCWMAAHVVRDAGVDVVAARRPERSLSKVGPTGLRRHTLPT